MKKIIWQVLGLAVLVVGGYGLLKLYPELMPKEGDIWVPLLDQVSTLGPQILYQTTQVVDRGTEEVAEDDVEQTVIYRADLSGSSVAIATINADESFGGLPWAEVIGQRIFVHRYTASDDAWLDLEGTAKMDNGSISNTVSSRDGAVWANYTLAYDNRTATVSMHVQKEGPTQVASIELDPIELGIDGPGYAMPFVVSDDGSTVYIREICECDAISLLGLWAFDVDTEVLTKISYVMEHKVVEYKINPATKQMIGVSYERNGPETDFGGGAPSGPSAIHLVDLQTGEGEEIFASDTFVFGNAFLSPDGSSYAHDYRDNIVRMRAVGAPRLNSDDKISGYVLDWVGDTLIVDRDGEIILYDVKADTVTSLARTIGRNGDPDSVRVKYVGVIDNESKL